MNNKSETLDKMANMLKQSRLDSGKSQQYMADALGVSCRTVQNWEKGIGCPTVATVYDWFNILCIPPHPYLLYILYPDVDKNTFYTNDEHVTAALIKMVKDLPYHEQKKLAFILEGKHGSSPVSVIDMMVANLQCPLRDRLNICQNIISNYELSEKLGVLTNNHVIRPSVDKLKSALEKAIAAVSKRLNSYMN